MRILVFERDLQVRCFIQELFELEGWETILCSTLPELTGLLSSDFHLDAVVLDEDLPCAEGPTVISMMRAQPRRRYVPVILFMAQEIATVSGLAEADLYLRRPEGAVCLASAVKRLCRA